MPDRLTAFLAGVGRPRIAVVGDAILDAYVWGNVERISPEAPIPVLRVTRREHRLGGAGSVVANLVGLGAMVDFVSLRGTDAAGSALDSLLSALGVPTEGIVVEPSRPTTTKTRHLGSVQHADRAVQQILRVDEEQVSPLGPEVEAALLRRLADIWARVDLVCVPDYQKGLVTPGLLDGLRALEPRRPILVDPALDRDYSIYRGVRLISPNRYEAGLASGIRCADEAGCAAAAASLLARLDLEAIALTMDRDGILLLERGGEPRRYPARIRDVADVTGAGDMVLAVLGLVLAAGGTLDLAVELANVAAGIEVRKIGVQPVSREEIVSEVLRGMGPGSEKIVGKEELARVVERARKAGRRLVFTNGCFDLLHAGHQHLLQGAAREGDILIVGVNSDASVNRLKGPGRPRIPLEDRMLMLAGLEAVRYVAAFEEDTPMQLLELVRPDVLVKGEEYRRGVVVGREFVESYGGRVAFVSQIPGLSTTAILASQH